MTFFGKLLVFLNVALCVVLLTWAIGLYSQRVDWAGEGAGGLPKGEVAKLRDQLQPRGGWGLLNELQAAESRFQTATTSLDAIDQVRAANATWYDAQLKLLDTSMMPVQELVFENGKISLEPRGQPKLVPFKDAGGREMNGYAFYLQKIADTETQIKTTQDAIGKLIEKDAMVAEEIGGPKGLLYWLAVEKVKKDGVEEEVLYLEPLLLNTAVEKALILRRQKDLLARKVELENARLATR